MNRQHLVAAVLAVAGLGATALAPAITKSYQAPADTVMLISSDLPGYAKAQANCTTCHSAEYFKYQPPNASRAYWDAMVHRMKTVFKAPVDDADMPAIVDYLAKTYSKELPH